MSASSEPDPESLIRSLAKASGRLTRQQEYQIDRAAEVCKDVMTGSVQNFITEAEHRPCSRTTSSDGTPIMVSHRVVGELPSGRVFQRSGRACHEFQVNISFYKCLDPSVKPRAWFRDPVPMTEGKTAAAEWSIVRSCGPTLREAGHAGMAVEHYAWDRAKFTALERMAKAHHNQAEFPAKDGVPKYMIDLSEFVVTTACACHDTNKAQEWGMMSEFRDRDLLRDVFVGIASIRNTWHQLTAHMCQWIGTVLTFAEPLSQMDEEKLCTVYEAMGVVPDMVETLGRVLQLRWAGGKLVVQRACATMPGFHVVSTVKQTLLACWRIQQFTESRWHTVGTSSQGVVIGLLTGLSGLVDYLAHDVGKGGATSMDGIASKMAA